ncbi:hypothetical protein HK405_001272, partial [Cladochytrium tenue]
MSEAKVLPASEASTTAAAFSLPIISEAHREATGDAVAPEVEQLTTARALELWRWRAGQASGGDGAASSSSSSTSDLSSQPWLWDNWDGQLLDPTLAVAADAVWQTPMLAESLFSNPVGGWVERLSHLDVAPGLWSGGCNGGGGIGCSDGVDEAVRAVRALNGRVVVSGGTTTGDRRVYADLATHLVAVFFAFLNPSLRLVVEEDFMADYQPVNSHPECLVYAIMGFASIYSKHP